MGNGQRVALASRALFVAAVALLARAAADTCSPDPMANFPINLMGEQVFGLGNTEGGSLEDCAAKCCADAACNVFSYCPANSLACGKQSPTSSCSTGPDAHQGNCSDGGGAEWCNQYSYAKATCKDCPSPFPDCAAIGMPLVAGAIAQPPRLPTGVPGATGRAGDGWGVNFHANEFSGKDAEYDMVARAFRVARLDIGWGSVENKAAGCGKYDFSAYDAMDAALRARGVQPMYVLDYWSDCYTASGQGCADMACAEAFGAFGAAAMAHFPKSIFECQNEPQGPPFYPNSNWTLVTYMCYAVRAKAAASSALAYWVGPTTSWFDYNFFVGMFYSSCPWNAFHAWSIHPYTNTVPELRLHDMAELSDYIWQSAGRGAKDLKQPMQVLSSEWGYVSCEPGLCTDSTQQVPEDKPVA